MLLLLPDLSKGLGDSPRLPIGDKNNAEKIASGQNRGEVLVRFKKGYFPPPLWDRGAGRRVITKKEYTVLSKRRNRVYEHLTSNELTTAELLEIFRSDPEVEAVSPNYARKLHRRPNDDHFDRLWGLHNIGQVVNGATGTSGADIDAIPAWNITTGSPEIVVAVIDSGVFYDHEDLFPNMWHNADEVPGNKIDDDGNGYIDDIYGFDFAADNEGNNDSNPIDIDTHGSHVAGTIAASGNNGIGITGVSWNTQIMALKAMRPDKYLYDSDLIEAIEYVIAMKERGINIVAINASYGSSAGSQADPMRDVIAEAGEAGIIFVASAGNQSSDNDRIPTYPASYDAPNIIAVAASDQEDNLAFFSNYGQNSVDLAAPGVNIFSAGIELAASVTSQGLSYTAVNFEYAGFTFGTTGPIYDCGKGYPNEFPTQQSNFIALIERGSGDLNAFYFWQKVQNAEYAEAAAVIIYNDTPGLQYDVTLLSAGNWLPAVFISQADGQYLASIEPSQATVVNVVSSYRYLNGTSMAAPHVTGAVAIVAAAFPQESVAQRFNRILEGTDFLETLDGLVSTGGRLNLDKSLRLYGTPGINMAPIYHLLLLGPN